MFSISNHDITEEQLYLFDPESCIVVRVINDVCIINSISIVSDRLVRFQIIQLSTFPPDLNWTPKNNILYAFGGGVISGGRSQFAGFAYPVLHVEYPPKNLFQSPGFEANAIFCLAINNVDPDPGKSALALAALNLSIP